MNTYLIHSVQIERQENTKFSTGDKEIGQWKQNASLANWWNMVENQHTQKPIKPHETINTSIHINEIDTQSELHFFDGEL